MSMTELLCTSTVLLSLLVVLAGRSGICSLQHCLVDAGLDPRILAALSSQRPNAAQVALAQAQAQNEAAEQVRHDR